MYDIGAKRWLQHVWLIGLLIGVLGPVVLAVTAVAFDAPWIMLTFLTGAGFTMLDFVRFIAVTHLAAKLKRQRMLDGATLLPALAIYARDHGWRAAVSGVPGTASGGAGSA